MIIDYPDSKPAFEDLHAALPQTNLRKDLIKTVKQVYENRILHPGKGFSLMVYFYDQGMRHYDTFPVMTQRSLIAHCLRVTSLRMEPKAVPHNL